jgi:hypothetical protein
MQRQVKNPAFSYCAIAPPLSHIDALPAPLLQCSFSLRFGDDIISNL